MKRGRFDGWLAAVVLGHFVVTAAHGAAHRAAQVPLGLFSTLFVVLVIEIGPLAGLALTLRSTRAGASLVAASMVGALAFGFINHFVIVSPDHVHEVAAAARPLFETTAWLLVLSEAAGAVVALRHLVRPVEESS
jgi:hypothetical protein